MSTQKYAAIQLGCCVFGIGNTPDEAITDGIADI